MEKSTLVFWKEPLIPLVAKVFKCLLESIIVVHHFQLYKGGSTENFVVLSWFQFAIKFWVPYNPKFPHFTVNSV